MSQEDVANEAGLERAYYGRVERGEANVSVTKLLRIAEPLNSDRVGFFPKGGNTGSAPAGNFLIRVTSLPYLG